MAFKPSELNVSIFTPYPDDVSLTREWSVKVEHIDPVTGGFRYAWRSGQLPTTLPNSLAGEMVALGEALKKRCDEVDEAVERPDAVRWALRLEYDRRESLLIADLLFAILDRVQGDWRTTRDECLNLYLFRAGWYDDRYSEVHLEVDPTSGTPTFRLYAGSSHKMSLHSVDDVVRTLNEAEKSY